MVTGKEYIFDNIYEARDYILSIETKTLSNDPLRKSAPVCINPPLFNMPFKEYIKTAHIPMNCLDYSYSAYFNEADDCKFIMSRLKSGRYSLKPNLKNHKFLFRGETEFHSPCKPNLFRDSKKKYFLDSMIYGDEMIILILSHPLVQLFDLGIKLNGKLIRFEMNLYGLLQHYYNQSPFLDLTSDINVALFFATQKYDRNSDKYIPVIDENNESGIIYFYDIDIDRDFKERVEGKQLSTIGLQVFPRSGRQKGFLYKLNKDDNFNNLPQLKAFRFKHKADIAIKINEQMNQGETLFPNDILKTHWCNFAKMKNVISKDAIKINLIHNPEETFESIEEKLKSLYQMSIQDYRPRLTTKELHQYYETIKNESYWEEFCNHIYIPGDTDGKMIKDLMNLPNNPEYEWAFKEDVQHVIDYKQGYLLKMYEHILKV